jgi:acetolactate synthase-1/3 small subunit
MHSVLSVLVENESGVLARISGLFSRRGYNIESLNVGPCEQGGLSRMVIVTNEVEVEQIKKQLNKLINVIKITDFSNLSYIDRELALIKVNSKHNRAEIIEIVNLFRANIIDVGEDSLIVEITGNMEKISAIIQLLTQFGIKEVARTGAVALLRNRKNIGIT